MEKDPINWAEMERWSSAMFGNVHRLPVAAAALELDNGEGVYPEAIKARLRLPSSTRAIEQLDRFVIAGLLMPPSEKRTGERGRPRKMYVRSDDEFWECLASLARRRFTA